MFGSELSAMRPTEKPTVAYFKIIQIALPCRGTGEHHQPQPGLGNHHSMISSALNTITFIAPIGVIEYRVMRVTAPIGVLAPIGVMSPGCDGKKQF